MITLGGRVRVSSHMASVDLPHPEGPVRKIRDANGLSDPGEAESASDGGERFDGDIEPGAAVASGGDEEGFGAVGSEGRGEGDSELEGVVEASIGSGQLFKGHSDHRQGARQEYLHWVGPLTGRAE